MTAQNYAVTTDATLVTLILPEKRGALRMTPEAAAYLAQQLFDAANEIRPGTVMKIGGWK